MELLALLHYTAHRRIDSGGSGAGHRSPAQRIPFLGDRMDVDRLCDSAKVEGEVLISKIVD